MATSCEELTHWKRLWCWERLRAGGKGDARGWNGWMASLTDGLESEWTPGVCDGQGGLACCNSWGRKESDTTERLNWTELKVKWGLMGVPDPVWLVFLWEEIRTQIYTEERPGEDGCPKAREWGLGRNQPCPHPDFGLPASRTVRK